VEKSSQEWFALTVEQIIIKIKMPFYLEKNSIKILDSTNNI